MWRPNQVSREETFYALSPARRHRGPLAAVEPDGVLNTDLARQLEVPTLGARLWRLRPGEASTRHRHRRQVELYLLLEGRGRVRVEEDLLTLRPSDALAVEPPSVRQLFNDTAEDQLWLVVGAPPEPANTLEMSEEELGWLYPDGHRALPPELEG